MRFHQCTLAAGCELDKNAKISPTFRTFAGLLRLNELLPVRYRVPVNLGVRHRVSRAADKLRTDRHYCFISEYIVQHLSRNRSLNDCGTGHCRNEIGLE